MHASNQRIMDILAAAGQQGEVRVLEDSTRTAAEAATALGCEVGAIASSLVFLADGVPILVLTSGRHRVNTDALAGRIGVQHVTRASAEEVRQATGQPIGGVAPVGHPEPVPTYVDIALRDYEVLWAAAGTPHSVFNTTYADLLALTSAVEVDVE